MSFPDDVRERALLWCNRHCCVCGKQCGVLIELHHIVPKKRGGTNEQDNALPVCFECHGLIQHYNDEHASGNKFKPSELKKRRDQIYEEHTSRYVPSIQLALTQKLPSGPEIRSLPDIGFRISHPGGPYPVQAYVKVERESDGAVVESEYYNGLRAWNLNPGFSILGHFEAPGRRCDSPLSFRISTRLVDVLGRDHNRLPIAYTFLPEIGDWYLEPSPKIAETIR